MKKLVKLIVPILIVVALFFGVKKLTNKAPQEGEKNVVINIKVKEDDETFNNLYEIETQTDEETVGDLLDKLNDVTFDVEFNGEKDSESGRFIVAIDDYKTEDMQKGPWWMIYSDTNKDCLEAGFCNGIDLQNVYDEDVFDLVFE